MVFPYYIWKPITTGYNYLHDKLILQLSWIFLKKIVCNNYIYAVLWALIKSIEHGLVSSSSKANLEIRGHQAWTWTTAVLFNGEKNPKLI